MIICPRCGKDNQNHYKFCLGCGYELPSDAARQPKSFAVPSKEEGSKPSGRPGAGRKASAEGVTPGDMPTLSGAKAKRRASGAAKVLDAATPNQAVPNDAVLDAAMLACPQCSSVMPRSFRFCHVCGFALAQAAEPPLVAPAASRKTAKPRADRGQPLGKLTLLRSDGSGGESLPLHDEPMHIGRDVGGPFARDFYLSPLHAMLEFQGPKLVVFDQQSLNGVFVRLAAKLPTVLPEGATFRIGQQLLRFNERGHAKAWVGDEAELLASPDSDPCGFISLVVGEEGLGNRYCVPRAGLLLGRESGDVLFPDDGYVSALHCRMHAEGDAVMLTDLGSSNGTFIRIQGQQEVQSGSILLLGQQLCRVEY